MLFKSFVLHKFVQNLVIFSFWTIFHKKIRSADGSVVQTTLCVELTSLVGNAFVMDCQVGDPEPTLCPCYKKGTQHASHQSAAAKKHTVLSLSSLVLSLKGVLWPWDGNKYREQKHRLMFAFCGVTAGGILGTCYGLIGRMQHLWLGVVCYCALACCGITKNQTNQI